MAYDDIIRKLLNMGIERNSRLYSKDYSKDDSKCENDLITINKKTKVSINKLRAQYIKLRDEGKNYSDAIEGTWTFAKIKNKYLKYKLKYLKLKSQLDDRL
jgi:Fe2+ transport system protein FeoA